MILHFLLSLLLVLATKKILICRHARFNKWLPEYFYFDVNLACVL